MASKQHSADVDKLLKEQHQNLLCGLTDAHGPLLTCVCAHCGYRQFDELLQLHHRPGPHQSLSLVTQGVRARDAYTCSMRVEIGLMGYRK